MRGVARIPRFDLRGADLLLEIAKAMRELTAQQRRFVEEYVSDLNTTQAAIRAGYGTKAATAGAAGSRLLAKEHIANATGLLLAARAERSEITAEWVLSHLKENAEKSKAIGNYQDSNRALELIGRHLQIWTDKVDVTSKGQKIEQAPPVKQVMIYNGKEVEF